MDTKIFWLWDNAGEHFAADPEDQELIFSNILRFAQGVARPSTQFVVNSLTHNVAYRPMGTYKYNRNYLAVEALERLKQAEGDGFDAAFAGLCYGEFFLREARQAVRMPVVGPAEASMMVAQMLGDKFAVVTVAPHYLPGMEENIRMRGWQDRAIRDRPIRYWTPDFTRLMVDSYNGRPERMIEEFEAQAKPAIESGADVIICGCNPMGSAFSQLGYNEISGTGVPVVTPLPAMIKQAEMMADLHRSLGLTKTEAVFGPYRSTPQDILDNMADRGIGMAAARRPGQSQAEAYVPASEPPATGATTNGVFETVGRTAPPVIGEPAPA